MASGAAAGILPAALPAFPARRRKQLFLELQSQQKSLTLDLGSAESWAILLRLVPTGHAVANNMRGDLPTSLGLDYAAL